MKDHSEAIRSVVLILSLGILLIGGINCLAFAFPSKEALALLSPKGVIMAFPTALALTMVGLCLMLLARKPKMLK